MRPLVALLFFWPSLGIAAPKVCGNQAALGDFTPDRCPALRDDGVSPDEAQGDGVFTLEVTLAPTALLRYKILPSGTYGPDEIRQIGDCGRGGLRDNATGDLLVPEPDLSQPARFYYDSARRTGGDSLMTDAPKGTAWVAVGSFQDKGFDPALGTVDLLPMGKGLLQGVAMRAAALPAGWSWKVLEKKGTYDGARKYGPDGWSLSPCDSQNLIVDEAVPAGGRIEFRFAAHTGRLETQVFSGPAPDGPAPVPDMGGGPPAQDLSTDMIDKALPGIRCDCRMAGAQGGGGRLGGAAIVLVVLVLGIRRGYRRRRGGH